MQRVCACVCVLSHVLLFATPRTIAHQAPLSLFSPGKGTVVGCHFLLQGIFMTQEWNPHVLHWQFFTPEPPGKPFIPICFCIFQFCDNLFHIFGLGKDASYVFSLKVLKIYFMT